MCSRALPVLRPIAEKILRGELDPEVELRWMKGNAEDLCEVKVTGTNLIRPESTWIPGGGP